VPRALAETVALLLLAATLAFAVVRPRGLPEAVVAVPAALLVVALGILPVSGALDELRSLGPTIGFLAAVLLLGELCEREGLFAAAGQRMASAARGRPVALLGLVFIVGAAITAVLSLDATVVLLTPVVFATTVRLRLRPKPQVYACTHLANSASLLLPVSNLTNLLAFRASGLSFARFATTMTLPWLAAIAVEWLVLRRFFASDLVGHGEVVAKVEAGGAPRYAVVVLALTLVGFGLASLAHIDEAVVAALGAAALAVPALRGRRVRPAELGRGLALPFLAFVAPLGWWSARSPMPGSARWLTGYCRRALRCGRCWRSPWSPRCWPTWSTTCPRSCCCCRPPRRAGQPRCWPRSSASTSART
jgi:arsenical pump membrane protein